MKGCVGVEGIFLGFSSNGNVRGQQDKAEGQNQDQVDQKEQTASVLGAQIRKAPDVFPTPTALPAAARTKPMEPLKPFSFLFMIDQISCMIMIWGRCASVLLVSPMSSIVPDIFRDKIFDVSFHETSAIINFFLYYIFNENPV